ncbi:penicillin acylase family protein [Flavilitoribacter nigricans]|uniref:Acylase n=1 Tax=Flavilitoribacter nigricans (strain ATCC 23147 / DSM 23189 / NBRC 102662 / NCIMB 1420 / SS-2) TaxID=1122177 RepID=A0A2D0NBP6_FLAN2|nr:penicillin acylase family protein [Flavilitoribacter nigricans]PHN05193.1 acylase [Flavilitoribacter nigricans DSM 23189 = NBRC 102662]
MKRGSYAFLLLVLIGCGAGATVDQNEILWDSWGIPHIYATHDSNLYQMMGWAQMRNHGNLVLKLMGEARARSAAYWGRDLERDQLLHQLGLIDAAERAFAGLSEEDRTVVEAFAKGINAYAAQHPEAIDKEYRVVLPVEARDIIYHSTRVFYFEFLINRNLGTARKWAPGSNGWAVNGSRTTSGNSMLLANPHLPWNDFWLFFEAHFVTPTNNLYGVTLVGLPVLGIAFNEQLGWTHTVNTLDNVDYYELNLQNGQYLLDGAYRDFEVDSVRIVSGTDANAGEKWVVKKRSEFGMVIETSGDRALAVTWPNMDGETNPLGQWKAMGEAHDLQEFQRALDKNALPLFNVLYSDKHDNILYHFGGHVPRKNGDWKKWQGVVPATGREELWNGYYAASELPGYLNPESGWLQNANDPPYTSTIPAPIQPEDYPDHIAPNHMSFRPQRSARLIQEADRLDLNEFIRLKHDTRSELALRLQDEFRQLMKETTDSLTLSALEVLTKWDGAFEADSEGAVLFANLINQVGSSKYFETPWSYKEPLRTPDGLKNSEAMLAAIRKAAETQLTQLGALNTPFGDVFRMKVGEHDYPGNGGPGNLGIFRTMNYAPGVDGRWQVVHGDTYICATEFGEQIQAKALLTYGNATQADNPHRGDQLKLAAEKQLREVWLSREQQEAHLELLEKLEDM